MDQAQETLQHLHDDFKALFDKFLAPAEGHAVTWDQVVKAQEKVIHWVQQHPNLNKNDDMG